MSWPGILYLIAVATALALCVGRVLLWRRGRPHSVPVWRGLLAIPRRYLSDVHRAVVREPSSARMHMAAAGGFVALNILILPVFVFGWTSFPLLTCVWIAGALTLTGAVLDLVRRRTKLGSRLSGGWYRALPWQLIGFASFFALATLPLAGLPWSWMSVPGAITAAVGVVALAFLIPGLALGTMRHAFAGAAHLAFHPRPERFEAAPATALKPLDLEAPVLGVETAEDFLWTQRLGFDACVQCGRCQDVCPAYAAGAPLNPKKLIFDLSTAASLTVDGAYAGAPHPGQDGHREIAEDRRLIGAHASIAADTLWACTTCRACVEACPMMIEHVDAIIDLRRSETLHDGATPGKGAEALDVLLQTDTVSGRPHTRLDWASDLALPLASDRRQFNILLWLGEAAFELRGQRILRALVQVLRAAEVDFAVLGSEELDVGDTARRLGDEALFQSLATRNIASLKRYAFERIVTIDPHVLHCLAREYPALGGAFRVEHHTSFVDDLAASGRLLLKPAEQFELTFHDPCYLGRYMREFDAPRRLIKRVGGVVREMERTRTDSFCCGWGGGAAYTDVPAEHRIPALRVAQAKATGARLTGTACPNCAPMLESSVDQTMQIADVIELVARRLGPGGRP